MDLSPPEWLQNLSDQVLALTSSSGSLPSAGCHFTVVEDVWEVTIFAGATETVGGELDGRWNDPPFSLDLLGIPACFDELHQMWWQTQAWSSEDQLGSHLSAEGIIQGHKVWLRIKGQAPHQFGPAHQISARDQSIHDLW